MISVSAAGALAFLAWGPIKYSVFLNYMIDPMPLVKGSPRLAAVGFTSVGALVLVLAWILKIH